jgi:hypothetical protein
VMRHLLFHVLPALALIVLLLKLIPTHRRAGYRHGPSAPTLGAPIPPAHRTLTLGCQFSGSHLIDVRSVLVTSTTDAAGTVHYAARTWCPQCNEPRTIPLGDLSTAAVLLGAGAVGHAVTADSHALTA